VRGVHRRWFFHNRICLTLIFDDAIAGFTSLLGSSHPRFIDAANPKADAWFLDGFAPAKNPDLWTDELFHLMARFSHPDTTFATFTVARQVRDGLSQAGFSLEKRQGFGRKRDMLCGRFANASPSPNQENPPATRLRNSAFEATWPIHLPTIDPRKEAIVIGAGIAGCATAAALHKRGFKVTLIDRHGLPGQEASGNPQGILYPKLSVEDSPLALFGRHALCYSEHFYRAYWQSGLPGSQCGVLVLPENAKDLAEFPAIAQRYKSAPELVQLVQGEALNNHCGVQLGAATGLFFPSLGWVQPPAVCRWLTQGIPVIEGNVAELVRDESADCWQLLDARGGIIASAPAVVIAASANAMTFSQCQHLPLRRIRGQISAVPQTPASHYLRSVICGAGYLAPAHGGLHTLGATYDIDDTDTTLRPGDHQRNLATLAATDAQLATLLEVENLASEQLPGRAGIRCTTPDYLPIVGPAPDEAAFRQRFADFCRNAKADIPQPGCYLPGLWLNCGHGSRGLTYAPLAAELLAAQIVGEVPPLPRDLTFALNPARFLVRQLKRGTATEGKKAAITRMDNKK
jgi:tRNA 5-methylaminomethyl-2-thiouridine biosynthesis bifunctional protein